VKPPWWETSTLPNKELARELSAFIEALRECLDLEPLNSRTQQVRSMAKKRDAARG
jgi:hypothetical protein